MNVIVGVISENLVRVHGVTVIRTAEVLVSMFFFFSSRRRHTRLQGDWSSDVCSSDLLSFFPRTLRALAGDAAARFHPVIAGRRVPAAGVTLAVMVGEIGRASCRERV